MTDIPIVRGHNQPEVLAATGVGTAPMITVALVLVALGTAFRRFGR